MLWPQNNYDKAFHKIRQDALLGGSTVLILVASTTDSVCAVRILTQLLQQEQIAYKIKPIGSNDELYLVAENDVSQDDELKTVILVNCGAMINLKKKFPLGNNTILYVIDSHRPIHLSNIRDDKGEGGLDRRYIVFSDNLMDVEAFPSSEEEFSETEDVEQLANEAYAANESSSDEEAEFLGADGQLLSARASAAEAGTPGGSMEIGRKRKRNIQSGKEIDSIPSSPIRGDDTQTLPFSTNLQVEEGGKAEDSSDDGPEYTEARPAANPPASLYMQERPRTKLGIAKYKAKKQKDRDEYYRGSFYGLPSAAVMYNLSQQLNRDNNTLLWLALVALTDHYINDQMDHSTYAHVVQSYRQEVVGKNPDATQGFTQNGEGEKIPISDEGKISFTEEYRFMLHRHWSLYDAMYYSRFVSSRLGIWKMGGREKLKTFMAQMGVSLKESQQNFCFMGLELKSRLREKIDEYAEEFGLSDIVYGSFTRFVGFGQVFSAADYAFAIMAELECGAISGFGELKDTMIPPRIQGPEAGRVDEVQLEVRAERAKVMESLGNERRFNAAYNIVSEQNVEILRKCVSLSMEVQRAVIRQGIALVEQKKLTNAGKFRYAYIENMSDGDIHYFHRPTLLAKLGLWLVEAAREAGKRQGRGKLPIVLCVLNEIKGMYMCVGVTCPSEFGLVEKNSFGTAFKKAAAAVQVKSVHGGFETACIQVAKDDVTRFTESLYLTLEEMDDDYL